MSSIMGFGPAGAQRFSRNSGRSVTGEGVGTIRYPSPFFDIAHTYLPSTFKTMLRWCRYYFLSNPLINAVCYKMAEYPVTDLVFDTSNQHLKNKWSTLFTKTLKFKSFEVEAGLDENAYGNCLISIFYPIVKHLKCKHCQHSDRVNRVRYTFRDFKFFGSCRGCNRYDEFTVIDQNVRSVNGIRLIRWDPEQISIQHNAATGESQYYYTIPSTLANDIKMAKRHIIEKTPQIFIEALRQNKSLLFDSNNLFHLKRATIAQKDKGWGLPMILPVLKDTFYLQILRKAQEAIAIEHIVPLRVLFPQSASGTSDVYCVSLESLVETRDGPRPAREVEVNDYLKSRVGNWERVEAAVDRPIDVGEKVFKFKVASLSAFPFAVSEEHPIYASKKCGGRKGYDGLSEPDYVAAQDLKKGDFVLYPTARKTWVNLTLDLADYIHERAATERFIYRRLNRSSAEVYEYFEARGPADHEMGERKRLLSDRGWSSEDYANGRTAFTQQESIDRIDRFLPVTKDLAYLIGLYAAEGSLNGGSPCFSLHRREESFRQEIDRIVESCGFRSGHAGTYDVSENGVTHNVHDVLLGEFLKSACGDSAAKKRLPRFILEAPGSIAMFAALGLLSGDGCNFNTETRRIGLSSTSPNLVVGLRSILLSEGFIPMAQVKIPKEGEISKLPSYQLNLNGAQADELAKRFGWERHGWAQGEDECWSRCGFIRNGYVYLRINEVEEAPEVKTVRGFQMSGDKSFCVVGVATHNSTINLQGWKQKIEQEILRWRLDNNYIPILPLPIGQQTLGAEGRALMLAQEYRVWAEHIVAGMGVPIEFVFGGMQYCTKVQSYVFTSKGMSRLEELIPTQQASEKVHGLSAATHLGKRSILVAHNTGLKKAACIKTRLGLDAGPSHEHRYLVLGKDMSVDWKKTSELQPGAFIAVKPGQQLWATEVPELREAIDCADIEVSKLQHDMSKSHPVMLPEKLTKPLARLLGYLVAEGACASETEMGFAQKDPEILEDFRDCVEAVFGYRPNNRKIPENGCTPSTISRRRAVAFLRALGLTGYADDKLVPRCIREAPKEFVMEFLRAYFEGDGGTTDVIEKQCVQASSKSEILTKELQLLLLNAGVVSSRYAPTEGHPLWRLSIRSEYVDKFVEEVGFVSSRKRGVLANRTPTGKTHVGGQVPYLKEALDAFRAKHLKGRSAWTFEPINIELEKDQYTTKEVAKLLDCDPTTVNYHIKMGKLAAKKGDSAEGRFTSLLIARDDLQTFLSTFGKGVRRTVPGRDAYGMTYSKLSAQDLSLIREKDPELCARLEFLAEQRYVWNEITEIELFDYEVPMGDLTVEEDSSYVADGLVCHNSGSNVSMRILENHFLAHKADHHAMVDWIMENVGAYMGWEPVQHHFKRFKMADDLQRSAYYLQLNQAGKLSDRSLLEETDWDSDVEAERIALEQKKVFESQRRQALSQAQIQGEAQLTMQKYQLRAQKMIDEQMGAPVPGGPAQEGLPPPMTPGVPGQASPAAQGQALGQQMTMGNMTGASLADTPPVMPKEEDGGDSQTNPGESRLNASQDLGYAQSNTFDPMALVTNPNLQAIAQRIASNLDQLPDAQKQPQITQLRQTNPQLYSLVAQFLHQRQGAHKPSSNLPQPQVRPARRGHEAKVV